MTDAQREAAALIWRHWQAGTVMTELPTHLRPETRADGYAIQARLENHSARPRVGWKIAATSAAGQAHIGVDGPLAGRLLSEFVSAAGTTVSIKNNRMRVCEPEFVFRMGRDLPPRAKAYDVGEVLDAVGALHLALELPDSRFADFAQLGGPGLIADDACSGAWLCGDAVTADWRATDLAQHRVKGTVEGRYEREGAGFNVLGDPRIALTWLVNELSGLGITLGAGEFVTTGTCMVPLEIEPGDRIVADFGDFGTISVAIAV